MVDREGQLEPVKRKSVPTRHQPSIVDEQADPVGAGTLTDEPARRFGPGAVATDHDDPHAGMSKAERGIKPDPGAGSGDDCDPCGSVGVTRH